MTDIKYPYSRNGKPYTEPHLILLADIDEHPWLPEWAKEDIKRMYQRHRATLSLFIGNIELAYRRGVQEGKESE